jgi:hypothetical protein
MKTLLWCPIDIPKCPAIPNMELDTIFGYWAYTKLTIVTGESYKETEFTDLTKKTYPELIDWFKLFPYKNIRNIKLNKQMHEVKPHIDFTKPELDLNLHQNNSRNEPCGYRILLRGSRKNKLYVIHNEEKIYCDIPEDTDTYVLGHTSVMHGVDADDDRWTIFTHFEIDDDLHKILLNKSLQKYSNFAIYR